jgi:mRNA interferase HigB
MRVIAVKTLRQCWEQEPDAEQALKAWFAEATAAAWKTPNELKAQYVNAAILNGKRVIFNIHGNKYRLIVDIEFRLGIVFIVWVGTHAAYDRIDANRIQYVPNP